MPGNFGVTSHVLFDSGDKMPPSLSNVAAAALLTLKFINYVRGDTWWHLVLVGENI